MKIVCIGGGPAGLYLAILMKKADPDHEIRVIERNSPDDTFGFGVVFSDATLGNLGEADAESYAEIRRHFAHWDDIDTYFGGERHRSTGHGFCGLERKILLQILQRRAAELGVDLAFETEASDPKALAAEADLLVGADGVGSLVRETYADALGPDVDMRPNKFVWLGTTFPFEAFTFYFNENEHGLWRVHAYRYQEDGSTFIVECTEETWKRAGMDRADEDQTIAYLEELFARELDGHRLVKNRSIWRSFPTIRNRRWHTGNVVLVGDAVHTAHFSIGSGTKLAMEDCIALSSALKREPDVERALALYEEERRPDVEKLQRAAQTSLEWFENTERYVELPPIQFTFSLLTRSLRVTHENLRVRDPDFVGGFDRWFADRAAEAAGVEAPPDPAPAPRMTPARIGELVLRNRLVGARGCDPGAAAKAAGLVMLKEPTSANVDAVHAAGAAAGATAGAAHPGYSLPEPPPDEDPMVGLGRRLASTATGLAEAGVDLMELDLSTGLLLELAAEPRERAALVALVAKVRAAWPGGRPLAARIAAVDREDPDGDDVSPDAAVALAEALREEIDLVTVVTLGEGDEARLANAAHAERVRLEVGLPVVCEGGVFSAEDIDSVIAAGRADLCAYAGDAEFRARRDASPRGRRDASPRGRRDAAR